MRWNEKRGKGSGWGGHGGKDYGEDGGEESCTMARRLSLIFQPFCDTNSLVNSSLGPI